MTQDRINDIVKQFYFDKIQLCTINTNSLDYLLYKSVDGGLKQFKGYFTMVSSPSSLTDVEFHTITDKVITDNLNWFNS